VGSTPVAGASSTGPARGGRVTFDASPGKMQLRVSTEGASSQVLDTEMREVDVPDFTGTQPQLGTPALFRARVVRDYQQLKTDPEAVPMVSRDLSRTDRVLIRVPAYGPGGATPTLSVHLLNRGGQPMAELPAGPSPRPGEQQIEVPLSSLAPGEYVIEIKATGESGEATEFVAFRIAG
jgi:hypothetical protein